jgi:hypothetical protein
LAAKNVEKSRLIIFSAGYFGCCPFRDPFPIRPRLHYAANYPIGALRITYGKAVGQRANDVRAFLIAFAVVSTSGVRKIILLFWTHLRRFIVHNTPLAEESAKSLAHFAYRSV